MKTFTDGQNQWSIEINVGSIKRVLASTGINLSLPHAPDENEQTLAERLTRDTILQVDVIYALLEPQARTIIKLSDEETFKVVEGETVKLTDAEIQVVRVQKFCELLKPEIMKQAEAALLGEWTDFFQKLGRTQTATAITQTIEIKDKMTEHSIKELGRLQTVQVDVMKKVLTDEVDKVVQQAADVMSGKLFGNATESPDESELETSTT